MIDAAALLGVGTVNTFIGRDPMTDLIDWGRFVSALTDVRYEGPACIEVEDRAFEADLDSRKAAIVQSQRYLRQFIIG